MGLEKIDLSRGTGGRAGSKVYTAPNGVVVTSSAAVYNNSTYYYMEYLFNGSIPNYEDANSYWMTSSSTTQTLTFDFQAIGIPIIREIRVWPRCRNNNNSNYRILVSDDNINYTEIAPWFINNSTYPYTHMERHEVVLKKRFIRFEVTYGGTWGSCLKEIEFYYAGDRFLIDDDGDIKTYKPVPISTGPALEFKGDITSYGIVPNVTMPDKEFTIEQWLCPNMASNLMCPFSYAANTTKNNEVLISSINSNITLSINNTNLPIGKGIEANKFVHLAVSWRSIDGFVQVCINGVIVYEGYNFQTNYSILQNGTLVLGQDQDTLGGGFQATDAMNGFIGETRVWNRVLREEEIKANMLNSVTGTEPGLVYCWDLSEKTGTTITDKVRNLAITLNNPYWSLDAPLITKMEFVKVGVRADIKDELFKTEGFDYTDYIQNKELNTLTSDNPKLLCFADEGVPGQVMSNKRDVILTAVPHAQLLFPTKDMDTTLIERIKWFRLETEVTDLGDVRAIVSFDEGKTWLYHDASEVPAEWKVVAPEYLNVNSIRYVGMPVSAFNTIPTKDWNYIRGKSNTLRVAYYLSINATSDKAHVKDLVAMLDLFGKWKHYGAAKYKYRDEELVVTLYKSADFKINYYR